MSEYRGADPCVQLYVRGTAEEGSRDYARATPGLPRGAVLTLVDADAVAEGSSTKAMKQTFVSTGSLRILTPLARSSSMAA